MKITAKTAIMLTVPAVILVASLAQGLFSLGKVFEPKDLSASPSSTPVIQAVKVGVIPSAESIEPFTVDVDELSNSDPAGLIQTVVGCSEFERALEGDLDFFVYQSRLSSLRSVDGYFEASRIIGSGQAWMFPVDSAVTYVEAVSEFLGQRISKSVQLSDLSKSQTAELGYGFVEHANVACGTGEIYSETLKAFRTLDSQIARVVGLIL